MLDLITPVILTYNEAPNIGRALECLCWARQVVVVDSHSTDETRGIVSKFPNVRLIERPFDCHGDQWAFALGQTGIETEWLLRLDADYIMTQGLIDEIAELSPGDDVGGYRVAFTFCIHGRPLRASLYPPKSILLRRGKWRCWQDGHTDEWEVEGRLLDLRGLVLHDDRKPISHWVNDQRRYMAAERDKLMAADRRKLNRYDQLRLKRCFAPILMLIYCLFIKRLILDGGPGIFYAFQRSFTEYLLSLYLIEKDVSGQKK